MRLKLALRNTLRNRRRTLVNVLMVAAGVTGLMLFRGFAHRLIFDLREITIRNQTGHIQIANQNFWEKQSKRPSDELLSNFETIRKDVATIEGVKAISGRLAFFGLVSTGEKSISARGLSIDPKSEQDRLSGMRIDEGAVFSETDPSAVMVGSGLAKQLSVKTGDSLTVLTYTFDGVVNALDLSIVGIFRTGLAEFDNNSFFIPFLTAQQLLATDKVQQLVIALQETEKTGATLALINEKIRNQPDAKAKTWLELSNFYQETLSFFQTQNGVIAFIIVSLVMLSIMNTVSMSVFERTGEIGTIRALGERERDILVEFLLEGVILGVAGALIGALLGTLAAIGINALELPIKIPGATTAIRVKISLFTGAYFESICLALISTLLASVFPARRASRMNIVDALRRNV